MARAATGVGTDVAAGPGEHGNGRSHRWRLHRKIGGRSCGRTEDQERRRREKLFHWITPKWKIKIGDRQSHGTYDCQHLHALPAESVTRMHQVPTNKAA